jgi:hypothetical protein
MEEGRASFSMAVQQKEEPSVCFNIELLSKPSDLGASLFAKHDFSGHLTVLGRTTLCNEVSENAKSSMGSTT